MFIEALLPTARTRLAVVRDDAPLMEAARLLSPTLGLVVVCDADGALAGVISKTDVVRQLGSCQGLSCRTAAALVMTREATVCRLQDSLADIWELMKTRGLKHIPVVDDEARPLGVLYAQDALQGLLGEVEQEELLLRDYVLGIGYR